MKTNNKYELVIIEQYLSWKGHYKYYFDKLISKEFAYIYCAINEENYPNATYVKPTYSIKKEGSFINFLKGRFFDSFRSYRAMINLGPKVAHIIEFEPFSFLLLSYIYPNRIPKLVITVHSIDRMQYTNWIKNFISKLQRVIYRKTLKDLAKNGTIFVTHYQAHKNLLEKVIGKQFNHNIRVIDYPCPKVVKKTYKASSNNKLLIYGQIRGDKKVFETLSKMGTNNLDITIAGIIYDRRLLSLPNITFINKYFSYPEFEELASNYQYMFLPYSETYTGGAGTFKDSLAYGMPVISTSVPIFEEIIVKHKVGAVVNSFNDILKVLRETDIDSYQEMSSNCHKYAENHGWDNLRKSYMEIYRETLS